jgi:hypothetical protein
LDKRWKEKRKEKKKKEKGERDGRGGKVAGVTPDERTLCVNSRAGSRPGQPDRLPLKQVILGEGTSGGAQRKGVPRRILVLVMPVVQRPIVMRTLSAKRTSSAERTSSAKQMALVAKDPDIERRVAATLCPMR